MNHPASSLTTVTNHNLFYDNLPVRMIQREDGQLWFVAKDVCDILDLSNSRMAVSNLDSDELMSVKITSGGQSREVQIISESGLYTLVIRSKKPQAKPFRRWVTHEVLPSIRKFGYYGEPPQTVNQVIVDRIDKLEATVRHLQMSFHPAGTVLAFVQSCCATGYQRQLVSKQKLYEAYTHFCWATDSQPEGLAHFCMKLYANVPQTKKASMTVGGKRVPAVRGMALLRKYLDIIAGVRREHLERGQVETERRFRLLFGGNTDNGGQLQLFPAGVRR